MIGTTGIYAKVLKNNYFLCFRISSVPTCITGQMYKTTSTLMIRKNVI